MIDELEDEMQLLDLNQLELPKKKTRKPRKKKEPVVEPEPSVAEEEEDQQDLEYYKEKLQNLADRNPEILTKDISIDHSAIDDMNLDEIKARIRLSTRLSCSKLDNNVTQNIISLTNQVCGRLLNCVDELEASTQNDELLHETAKNYLGTNILDYIPTEIKLAGLYGSHLGASYLKTKSKITETE